MATSLAETLAVKFPGGLPPWVDPLLNAARRIEVVEKREQQHALMSSDVKTKPSKKTKKTSTKTKSRKSKADVDGDVQDDEAGLGDDVTDEEMIKKAQEYLESAIELSNGEEALPFTWLSVCHTKNEDWTKARESASKAAELLDPFSPTALMRLAEALVREKQYVQAHLYFERALCFLPVPERAPYMNKLARIKEQAEDEKAHVYKEDPFDIFPLEVILRIMEIGLFDHRNFVLNASLVNRRWRNVLINSCNELWKTLTFSHSGFKTKHWEDKMKAWVERAGKIDTICFQSMSASAAARITRKQGKYLVDAKTVQIQVWDPIALERIVTALSPFERSVQHLQLGVRYAWHQLHGPSISEISCGLLPDVASQIRIQSIELKNIVFKPYDNPSRWQQSLHMFNPRPSVRDYPELKRLIVDNCHFANSSARMSDGLGPPGATLKYQKDALHNALRGCPNLEHLEVHFSESSNPWQACQPGQGKRILMPALKVAILPVPQIWCIDILAPQLENLTFTIPQHGFITYEYDAIKPEENQQPLIPVIEDSPVTADACYKLESVEFACYKRDSTSDLAHWASRLHNVTKLVIRNAGSVFLVDVTGMQERTDNRLSSRVIHALKDNLDWFPKLSDLEFDSCMTPGKDLVELVRKRKDTSGCAALQRLKLKRCSKLSDNAKLVLGRDVPFFVIDGEWLQHVQPRVRYIDEDITNEADNMTREE